MKLVKILITLSMLFILMHAQINNSDSLVAHYIFSKEYYDNQVSGKFYDLSGNGNHASPSDTFQFVEDHLGNPEGAMRFDGKNDFLDCGNSSLFNMANGNRTIFFWVRPKYNEDYYNPLFCKDGQNIFQFRFAKPFYYHFYIKNSLFGEENWKLGNTNYTSQNFQLLTLTLDNANKKISFYKNSVLVDTLKYSLNLETDGNFYLGTRNAFKNYFLGDIEAFSYYNKLFTVSEIEDLFDDIFPHILNWDFENGMITNDFGEEYKTPFRFSEVKEHQTTIYNRSEGNIIPFSGEFCAKHTCFEGHKRAELRQTNPSNITGCLTHGNHRWYSFMVYIPKDFDYSQERSSWICITQMLEGYHTDGGPNYSIHALENGFQFRAQLWGKDSNGKIAKQDNFIDKTNDIPYQRGVWNNIVYHIYARADSLGYFEGWINGIPILKNNGEFIFDKYLEHEGKEPPYELDKGFKFKYLVKDNRLYGQNIKINDNQGMVFKCGYYRWDNSITNSIFSDDIKIGKTAKSIGFISESTIANLNSIKLSRNPIYFEDVQIGQIKSDSIFIYNIGYKEISISNISLIGSNDFTLDRLENSKLPSGDSLKIKIFFNQSDEKNNFSIITEYFYNSLNNSINIQLIVNKNIPPSLEINVLKKGTNK